MDNLWLFFQNSDTSCSGQRGQRDWTVSADQLCLLHCHVSTRDPRVGRCGNGEIEPGAL